MNKIKHKIFFGAVFFSCSIIAIGGAAVLSDKISENAVPVSLVSEQKLPVIVLDAGHGGFDGGCVSVEGVPEKGINLSILLRLRDLLRISGYEVEVTRDTDTSIHDSGIEGIANQKSSDMDNRLELFNKYDNAVCISIHQNQFSDPVYNGAQMFYSATDSHNETLAKSLQSSFQVLQPENKREIKLCGKELFLCYYSENPTVMVECGFLSNPEEASLLNTEEYQQKVAMTIFNGINNFVAEK